MNNLGGEIKKWTLIMQSLQERKKNSKKQNSAKKKFFLLPTKVDFLSGDNGSQFFSSMIILGQF